MPIGFVAVVLVHELARLRAGPHVGAEHPVARGLELGFDERGHGGARRVAVLLVVFALAHRQDQYLHTAP